MKKRIIVLLCLSLTIISIFSVSMAATAVPTDAYLSSTNTVTSVTLGHLSSAASLKDGRVVSWGKDEALYLGRNVVGNSYIPALIPELTNIKKVVSHDYNFYAISNTGSVYSWGSNYFGRLGFADGLSRSKPELISGLNDVIDIAASDGHVLALLKNGTVMSWGRNDQGQLGFGNKVELKTPKLIPNLSNVKHIAVGDNMSIAVIGGASDKIYVWGNNENGQLGLGDNEARLIPTLIDTGQPLKLLDKNGIEISNTLPTDFNVNKISARGKSVILLCEEGAYSWGNNSRGQLGVGDITNRNKPTRVKMFYSNDFEIVDVKMNDNVAFALLDNGKVIASGNEAWNLLNAQSFLDPQRNSFDFTTLIPGLSSVQKLGCGTYSAFAITSDNKLFFWGDNSFSQLAISNTDKPKIMRPLEMEVFSKTDQNTYIPHSPRLISQVGLYNSEKNDIDMMNGKKVFVIMDSNPDYIFYEAKLDGKIIDLRGESLIFSKNNIDIKGLFEKYFTSNNPLNGQDLMVRAVSTSGEKSNWSNGIDLTKLVVNYKVKNITFESKTRQVRWDEIANAKGYSISLYSNGNSLKEFVCIDNYFSLKDVLGDGFSSDNIVVRIVPFLSTTGDGETPNVYVSAEDFVLLNLPKIYDNTIQVSSSENKGKVEVSWTPVQNAYAYEITIDGDKKNIGNKTKYMFISKHENTRHIIQVRPLIRGVETNWSNKLIVISAQDSVKLTNELILNVDASELEMIWKQNENQKNLKYDVLFDNRLIESVNRNFIKISNLLPNTTYNYKIRPSGELTWPIQGDVKTKTLDRPHYSVTSDVNSLNIMFEPQKNVESYALQVNDGGIMTYVVNKENNSIKLDGLLAFTDYKIRVRSLSSNGESNWTEYRSYRTLPIVPSAPVSLRANTTDSEVGITWDQLDNKDVIGYDIEINNTIIETGVIKKFVFQNEESNREFKLRVRAVTQFIAGLWSDYIEVDTLTGIPSIPSNINIENRRGLATITWDKEPIDTHFEIEINHDKQPVLVYSNSYVHRNTGLMPTSDSIYKENVYRLRSINTFGVSNWSNYFINNAIAINTKKLKETNLALTAGNVVDFSKYTLTINYNPDVLRVKDLCAYTSLNETSPGKIIGHPVEIIEHNSGKIVFKVNKTVDAGYTWSGIINNIIFEGKLNGGTTITYLVDVEN